MPADADALSLSPSGDVVADRVDYSGDLVPRDPRVLDSGPVAFLREPVAVADAASLDFDAHMSGARLRDFVFNNFKRPIRSSDLHYTHL